MNCHNLYSLNLVLKNPKCQYLGTYQSGSLVQPRSYCAEFLPSFPTVYTLTCGHFSIPRAVLFAYLPTTTTALSHVSILPVSTPGLSLNVSP